MTAALAGLREMARGPFWILPGIALAAWVPLVVFDQALLLPRLCGVGDVGAFFSVGVPSALAFNSAGAIALSSVLMVVAMTAPLLNRPLAQVWAMSFAERRLRAVALFALGFAMAWLLAIAVLILSAVALRTMLDERPLLPFLLVLGAAIVWQGTSWRRQCLNRCHARPALPAFGFAAEWGSVRFGLTNAGACIGACWPLMLLPFVAGAAHLYVMAVAATVMFAERHAVPRAARTDPALVLAGSIVVLASTAALI